MAKVLLIGLPQNDAFQLRRNVELLGCDAEVLPYSAKGIEERPADVIFASGDEPMCMKLLSRIRARNPEKPFVVVSRVAEADGWIQALEAGATDYCPSSVDRAQLSWIIQNARPKQNVATAAA